MGAKGIEEREQLQRLLSDAKQGCFGAVYVWELSRLSRNLRNLINIIQELDDIGVTLYSLREGVSTDTHSWKDVHLPTWNNESMGTVSSCR